MHSALQTIIEFTSCLPELYTRDMEERTMASELGIALGLGKCKGVRKARMREFSNIHDDWHTATAIS